MSYFERHVFFCTNKRDNGESACEDFDSSAMRAHCKDRMKAAGMLGEGKTRISSAGCLGRCDDGPVIAIYPEAVWYTWVDQEDMDEIIDEHLINGRIVERLKV